MKCIALAVLLAIMQAHSPVPRKAADSHTSGRQSVKKDAQDHKSQPAEPKPVQEPPASPISQQEGHSIGSDNADKPVRVSELPPVSVERDWMDCLSLVFGGALVIIGAVGVAAAVRTLLAIEKQASEMAGQRGVMEGQLEAMNSQLAEMKAAGEIARKQFDLTVSKEKPRLSVEVDPLEFEYADYVNARVKYRVRYSGITPAFITDSSAAGQITEFIAPEPLFTLPMKLPQTVLADAEDMTAPIFPPNFTSDDMDAIGTGDKFIHFIGFIKYTDVFTDRERETRFCFRWKISALYGSDARYGAWVKCGPPEATRTT
jgi:hypothetical protein